MFYSYVSDGVCIFLSISQAWHALPHEKKTSREMDQIVLLFLEHVAFTTRDHFLFLEIVMFRGTL
jgi:hypothetical protein